MKNVIATLLLVSALVCPQLWAQGEAVNARLAGTVLDPDEALRGLARLFADGADPHSTPGATGAFLVVEPPAKNRNSSGG